MIWGKFFFEKDDDELQISNKSETFIEKNYGYTLVKNIFNPKQINYHDTQSLKIVPK
jgi:hypothetical protein